MSETGERTGKLDLDIPVRLVPAIDITVELSAAAEEAGITSLYSTEPESTPPRPTPADSGLIIHFRLHGRLFLGRNISSPRQN